MRSCKQRQSAGFSNRFGPARMNQKGESTMKRQELSRLCDRESEGKFTAATRLALDPDFAAM